MKRFLDPEFEFLKLTLRDVICESSTEVDGDSGMIPDETLPGEEDDGFGEE